MPALSAPSPEVISQDISKLYGGFEIDTLGQLGVSDSAHGVVFGEIPGLGDVAVKPFTKIGKARHEQSNYERVLKKGFETIDPIDSVSGQRASYLISIRRRDLTNLAQRPWSESLDSEKRLADTFAGLGSVALDTAVLHDAGITHGDYQAKNIVYDSTTGLYVVADVERAQIDRAGDDHKVDATKDVIKVGESLLSKGVFAGVSPVRRVELLEGALLEPYLSSASSGNRPDGKEVLAKWADKAVKLENTLTLSR